MRPSTWQRPRWRAHELFVDASCRVVGWAMCGLSDGQWHSLPGWLEGGASVAAGEAIATAYAVELLAPGGRIISDCLAVKKMWDRIRRKPGSVSRAAGSLPCWVLLAEAMARNPTAKCSWMRGQLSAAEATAEGYPAS
jgi:hypothetical protein